jgi:transposase
MHNKTDENDAAMLSELAHTGFYKRIEVKSALLRARDVAIKSRMNAENTIRGLLASFGVKLPKHLRTYELRVHKVIEERPFLADSSSPFLRSAQRHCFRPPR